MDKKPHSMTHTHCHPIINCCNCIGECICHIKYIKPEFNNQTFHDTFSNKISYEMPKRVYNPISCSFYCRNQGINQGNLLFNDESKNNCNDLLNKCSFLEKENKKLKKLLKEYKKDLNNLREKDDINMKKIDNLKKKINSLNDNDNENQELYRKLAKLQKELNKNKRKNETLLNENDDLNQCNKLIMKENEKNKKIIEKLKNSIKECEDNKRNRSSHSQTKNSMTEDELVIINKECTYNNGNFGSEFNKEKYLKNNDFKKEMNIKLSENDIFKYHEIIQELSNMLLIYEHLYFNKEIRPKNNIELLCYLISHFIEKKIRKIKLNTLFKILISSIVRRNNNFRENNYNYLNEKYNNENMSKRGQFNKHKKSYYIERNKSDIY